jgi:transaldolase
LKFFLDTAPTLIAKEGRPLEEQVRRICAIVDGDMSAEVLATEAKAMIEEGRHLARIHKNIVVKCPLTRDGIRATAALSREGLRVKRERPATVPGGLSEGLPRGGRKRVRTTG